SSARSAAAASRPPAVRCTAARRRQRSASSLRSSVAWLKACHSSMMAPARHLEGALEARDGRVGLARQRQADAGGVVAEELGPDQAELLGDAHAGLAVGDGAGGVV